MFKHVLTNVRREYTVSWETENPILGFNVLAVEIINKNKFNIKKGDNITPWNQLNYWYKDLCLDNLNEIIDDYYANIGSRKPLEDFFAMYGDNNKLKSGGPPTENDDVCRLSDLNAVAGNLREHINSTTAHEAASYPAAGRIAMFDSDKGLKSGKKPEDDNDVIRFKEYTSDIGSINLKLSTINGAYNIFPSYDFGKNLDTDDQNDVLILNTYSIANTPSASSMNDVLNNSVVINTFDYTEYIYNKNQNIWVNYGNGFLTVATNERLGVVRGTDNPGDGSKDMYVKIMPDGSMRLIGEIGIGGWMTVPDYAMREPVVITPSTERWVKVNGTFGTGTINAVVYGNKFIAAGAGGKMAYSSDGITWNSVSDSTFGSSTINAVTFGNNKFAAVGAGGKIAYSSDGITWNPVSDSTFGSSAINAVTFGGGKFVAVGASGKTAYSSDGITWNSVSDSTFGSSTINAVTFGNNKFVAVGAGGKMAYSSDGITWNTVSDSTFGSSAINSITFGNNKFAAGGAGGKMAYSSDGITWAAVNDSTFGGLDIIHGIAYGDKRFIAAGSGGDMAYSPDGGITWIQVHDSSFGTSIINAIAYSGGGGKFIAVGAGGKIAYSPDGTTWTAKSGFITAEVFFNGDGYAYLEISVNEKTVFKSGGIISGGSYKTTIPVPTAKNDALKVFFRGGDSDYMNCYFIPPKTAAVY
jgi:hypothetical protein